MGIGSAGGEVRKVALGQLILLQGQGGGQMMPDPYFCDSGLFLPFLLTQPGPSFL